MMSNNYLKQLNGTYEQYTKLFEQSDGKKLHRASDDAVGYSKYLRYQNSLKNVEQFQDDITTAVSWMKNSDSALINVTDQMNTFKEKVVAAGNSTNNESDMKDIAKELLAGVQEIVSDLNVQIGDRYLFSGQSDTTMPFQISGSKKSRGETKTLGEAQASFFNDVNDDATVTQMLKLTGSDKQTYYMNVANGNVYTEDFVENGYKDKAVDGSKVAPGDEAGTVSSWGGSTDVSKYFDEYGVINAAGDAFEANITVGGEKVSLKFSVTQQYIVEYRGDAKYISMVKRTGGVNPATDSVNQTGQDVFGSDIFDKDNSVASGTAMLNELLYAVAKIESGDNEWAANDGLTISDAAHSHALGAQTTMAARQQAYTAASDMLTTQNESITSDITDVASTDVAQLATKLMEYQTIYSLSLSVGSKILPGTLADYL
ncbi:MAG: flagellar hook-associated protein FlgL [Anaerovibrio sp.]|nr:flagellar hook-associated protein FlgL [Anaerovibrio sp.]